MEQQTAVLDDTAILDLLARAFAYAKPDQPETLKHLTLDASVEELGIESVSALEMAGFIEEELDIQFSDHELVSIRSMRDLAQLIRKYNRD